MYVLFIKYFRSIRDGKQTTGISPMGRFSTILCKTRELFIKSKSVNYYLTHKNLCILIIRI